MTRALHQIRHESRWRGLLGFSVAELAATAAFALGEHGASAALFVLALAWGFYWLGKFRAISATERTHHRCLSGRGQEADEETDIPSFLNRKTIPPVDMFTHAFDGERCFLCAVLGFTEQDQRTLLPMLAAATLGARGALRLSPQMLVALQCHLTNHYMRLGGEPPWGFYVDPRLPKTQRQKLPTSCPVCEDVPCDAGLHS